jgi:hypothetical protein
MTTRERAQQRRALYAAAQQIFCTDPLNLVAWQVNGLPRRGRRVEYPGP